MDEIEKICHGKLYLIYFKCIHWHCVSELGTNDIDFQIYLDLVAHKFSLKADKQELINAFNILDRSGNGKVLVSDLKHILCSIGEKLTVSYKLYYLNN